MLGRGWADIDALTAFAIAKATAKNPLLLIKDKKGPSALAGSVGGEGGRGAGGHTFATPYFVCPEDP